VSLKTWIIDALERAGKTVVQVFASVILTLGVAAHWQTFWHALDVGLLAGVVSLLTSVLSVPIAANLAPAAQVAMRALLTFVQAGLSYLAANTFLDLTSVPWLQVLQVALIATVTSILTSWASYPVGPLKGHPSVVAGVGPAGG
jgi:hypothetical protein